MIVIPVRAGLVVPAMLMDVRMLPVLIGRVMPVRVVQVRMLAEMGRVALGVLAACFAVTFAADVQRCRVIG